MFPGDSTGQDPAMVAGGNIGYSHQVTSTVLKPPVLLPFIVPKSFCFSSFLPQLVAPFSGACGL